MQEEHKCNWLSSNLKFAVNCINYLHMNDNELELITLDNNNSDNKAVPCPQGI